MAKQFDFTKIKHGDWWRIKSGKYFRNLRDALLKYNHANSTGWTLYVNEPQPNVRLGAYFIDPANSTRRAVLDGKTFSLPQVLEYLQVGDIAEVKLLENDDAIHLGRLGGFAYQAVITVDKFAGANYGSLKPPGKPTLDIGEILGPVFLLPGREFTVPIAAFNDATVTFRDYDEAEFNLRCPDQ